ncbi:hypothetical protein EDB80DRAFT_731057, partial [Ilyonectria destructans]
MCPFCDAKCNGVTPALVATATLAPFSISSLTTSICPFCDAKCNGVHPSSAVIVILASFSISSLTTSM